MLLILRGFLFLFLLYHILVTVLGYGFLGGNSQQIFALLRDGLWILLLIVYFFVEIKSFAIYWKNWKNLRYIFLALLGISLFFSYIQEKSFYDMFVGFKYGFYYIFIFLSATFLGHGLAKQGTKKIIIEQDDKLKKFLDFFVWTLVSIVAFGFVWQGAKILFPNFFFEIGYGPLNDFQFGTNPPLYYLTGFGGTLRWQGIFSGPNNYGYFLVVFLPLIIHYFKFSINSLKEIFIQKTNLISLFVYIVWFSAIIMTLSRSAILGTIAVLFLINIGRWKRHWKVGIGILIAVILGVLGLSLLKETSTLAHITAKFSSISYVLKQPLGYGLGSSGPAIHHNGNILPENYFIQLLIDIGLLGFALFIGRYILLSKKIKKLISGEYWGKYITVLSIGRIALLLMGIFLHVFEDSMVNYSFFSLFGIIAGYIFSFKKGA
ncbi:MAG: hypothetical protein PHR61_01125 [Candidatus Absconditabacteria bacterium]|nr:hypothetical protein [Candidatus Absconditabacteria bacterium]